MNALDIGVVAVIGLSAVFAFARGFVREALSIAAWVGAGFITLYGFNTAYAMVDPMVHNPLLSQLIAGFGLFLVSLIILTIITGFIARSVRSSALSPIDRTLGFIFGLARGAFILSLACLLLDVAAPAGDRPQWLKEAKSLPYLQQGANVLRDVMPEQWRIKSATAAEEIPKVNSAEDAMKAIKALSNPAAPPAGSAPDSSQTPKYDRDQLNRLINNNQR